MVVVTTRGHKSDSMGPTGLGVILTSSVTCVAAVARDVLSRFRDVQRSEKEVINEPV